MYRWPSWIYEPLPYVYLLTGGFAVVGFDPVVGRISGLMLMTAAFIIITLRRDNRACLTCDKGLEALRGTHSFSDQVGAAKTGSGIFRP